MAKVLSITHLEQFNVTAVLNDYVEMMWMRDVCVCVCVFKSFLRKYVISNVCVRVLDELCNSEPCLCTIY